MSRLLGRQRIKPALSLVALTTLFLVAALPTFARTWQSSDGVYSLDAEYVGAKDGKVSLRKPNGDVIEVPLAHLSAEDQAYVAKQAVTTDESSNAPAAAQDSAKPASAKVTMECERYQVEGGLKADRTVFTIAFTPGEDHLTYRKTSGPAFMVLPETCDLPLIWKSKDELRFVAKWTDSRYESDEKVWTPVILFDFDFSTLRYKVDTYGNWFNLDKAVSDPWKTECRRLD